MDAFQQDQVRAWLTYFDDIGLSAFYTDRAALELPAGSRAEMAASSGRVPAGIAPDLPPARPAVGAAAVSAPIVPAQIVPAPIEPSQTRAAPPPPVVRAPIAAPLAAALVSVASLFEAATRLDGDTLENIRAYIGDCQRCKLCQGRNKIVFGDGNPRADLVFVGEGPGRDEDMQGLPFVGRAGKLLTQMIEAMGLARQDVYIANVVKCRPPENRLPEKDEIETCSPFLMRQLDVIRPKVIVCLGNCASQTLIGTNKSISHFRGQWFDFRGARLIATYHPAYLLRNPAAKGEVWNDLKKVIAFLGLTPPPARPRA